MCRDSSLTSNWQGNARSYSIEYIGRGTPSLTNFESGQWFAHWAPLITDADHVATAARTLPPYRGEPTQNVLMVVTPQHCRSSGPISPKPRI